MFEFGSPTKKYHCTLCYALSSKIDSDANVIVLHYFSLACHLCHFHSSYMFMNMCVCVEVMKMSVGIQPLWPVRFVIGWFAVVFGVSSTC